MEMGSCLKSGTLFRNRSKTSGLAVSSLPWVGELETFSNRWREGSNVWQALPSWILWENFFWVSRKESDITWDQANSDPEGVAGSVTPTEAERSNDLDDLWAGEAVASGKLLVMKSTMALTVAGMGISSASFSSLEGEAGWVGEDREWGLSCEGSRDEARDEWRGGGETESLAS